MDWTDWHVYKPLDHHEAMGSTLQTDYCAHNVYYRDGVVPHQCSRKPKETIQGYGFCTQHAKMVREWLEQEKETS